MEITQELQKQKIAIDKEIEVYLDRVIQEARDVDLFFADALTYFKKTILAGGKRIRPILMYWGYEAAGGKNKEAIVKASISIELIHAFLLMHDDIIDRDDVRHGIKTMHARYRDYNKRLLFNNDAEHFGESIAMVIGDFVYSLGNQVLFESQFDPRRIIHALNKLQKIVGLTTVGEVQDVYIEYQKKATKNDILSMYENKTAKYTFEGPLQLGALLAGADDNFCDALSTYAVPVGIAFQIRDDMLGVFGDTRKTGKPVGSDIAEGKRTLMLYYALQKATKEQKNTLDRLLGYQDITTQDIEQFQKIIIDTGAKNTVEKYMEQMIKQAQDSLEHMTIKSDAKQFLFALTEHLNNREK